MRVHLTKRTGAGRDERGGVAVVVACLLVPFMLLTAFTADVGMAYAQAQAFASGADSAALAVARANQDTLNRNPTTITTCAQLLATDPGFAKAKAIAQKQVDANGPFGLTSTSGQIAVDVALSCVDGVFRVTVEAKRDVPTTLARIAGVNSLTAKRSASAGLSGATRVGGVFPMAICDQQRDAILATAAAGQPYPTVTLDSDKVWHPGCASGKINKGSGNWGWLDCGAANNGIPTIIQHIDDGCDVELAGHPATVDMGGTPGNKLNAGPLLSALTGAMGKTYAFPVYDQVSAQGSNTVYTVVGFVQLKIVGLSPLGDINVQYVSYSPTAEFDPGCGIGGPTACTSGNTWGIGLTG